MIKQHIYKIKDDFKNQIATGATAGIAMALALSWKEVIELLFSYIIPITHGDKILSTLFLTLFCAAVLYTINKTIKPKKKKTVTTEK